MNSILNKFFSLMNPGWCTHVKTLYQGNIKNIFDSLYDLGILRQHFTNSVPNRFLPNFDVEITNSKLHNFIAGTVNLQLMYEINIPIIFKFKIFFKQETSTSINAHLFLSNLDLSEKGFNYCYSASLVSSLISSLSPVDLYKRIISGTRKPRSIYARYHAEGIIYEEDISSTLYELLDSSFISSSSKISMKIESKSHHIRSTCSDGDLHINLVIDRIEKVTIIKLIENITFVNGKKCRFFHVT